MGATGERGGSMIAGGVALEWSSSFCSSSSSGATNEGADVDANEDAINRVPTAEATPPESKERETDPW
jgi:hypothetical protein